MAATQKDILRWLKEGKRFGATHLLVMCDTFDHTDYPIFVAKGDDPRTVAKDFSTNMTQLMEVYAIHLDWKQQLGEFRAFHWDPPPPTVKAKTSSSKKRVPTKVQPPKKLKRRTT